MSHTQAQQMVQEAVTQLHTACGQLLARHRDAGTDDGLMNRLTMAGRVTSESMNQLLTASKQASLLTEDFSDLAQQAEVLAQHCSVLMSQKADSAAIQAAYSGVAGAAGRMKSQAVVLASRSDDELKNKLVRAARGLADQTTNLYHAVKETSANPRNFQAQTALAREAGLLQGVAEEMASTCSREAAMFTLRHNAKMSAAMSLALASKARLAPTRDEQTRQNLLQSAQRVSQMSSQLIGSIGSSSNDPLSSATQATLVGQGKELASAGSALIAVSKRSGGNVSDIVKRNDLLKCAEELQGSLKDLLGASEACEDFAGGKEAKLAMQGLDALVADMDAAEMAAGTGAQIMSMHPGMQVAQLASLMEQCYHNFQNAKLQLEEGAFTNPEGVGLASLKYQKSLSGFVDVAKSMAAMERDKKIQREIVKEAKALVHDSMTHVNCAKRVSVSPGDAGLIQAMRGQGAKVTQDLNSVLDISRGLDLNVLDDAIRQIASAAQKTKQDFEPTKDFASYRGDILEQIDAAVSAIENVANAGESNLRALPQTLPVIIHALEELITAVRGCASTVKDPEQRPDLLRSGVQMATGGVLVLQAVKMIAGGGGSGQLENARDRVNAAAESLTNAANPGKVALEEAVERVRNALSMLSVGGHADSFSKTPLQDVSEGARSLGASTSILLTDVLADPTQFAKVAQDIAKAMEEVVNGSRIAADPSATEYSFAAKRMLAECDTLLNEKDFTKIVGASRTIGLKATEVTTLLKADTSDVGKQLKPVAKHLAASSLDVYRQVQAVARRTPGAAEALAASVGRLQQILQEFHSRSTTGKVSNPALTKKLLDNTQGVAASTEDLLVKSLHVSTNPKDAIATNDLYRTANGVSKGIQELMSSVSEMAPGAQETAQATQKIQGSIQKLQVLSLNAIGGRMARSNANKGTCQEKVILDAKNLTTEVQKLVKNTMENQDQIGPSAAVVAETLGSLVQSTEALASTGTTAQQQASTVDMSKGAADSVLQLILAVRNAAGNPYDEEALNNMSGASQTVRNAVSEIVMGLQGDFVAQQECEQSIELARACQSAIKKGPAARVPYHVIRKDINTGAIDLLTALNNLTQLASTNPDQLGMGSKEVADLIGPLVRNVTKAASTTTEAGAGDEIIRSAGEAVALIISTMEASKALAGDRQNPALQGKVSQEMNKTAQVVVALQESVKKADMSEKRLEEALQKIRATAASLESAGLMSSAGQFEMDLDPSKTLADHHTDLMGNTKTLRGACSEVFLGASGSLDALAQSALKMANMMDGLGNVSKCNAAMVSDSFSQQAVLHGAKAITIACQQLLLAAKDTNSRPNDPKAEKILTISNKAADEAIAQLVDVANKSSADIVENIKKIDAAKGKITNGYTDFSKPTYTGNNKANPPDIVLHCRSVAKMSAQVVASISSNSDMTIEAVENIATYIINLFADSRGCTRLTSDAKVGQALQLSVRDVAQVSLALLDTVKQFRSDKPETHNQVSQMSNRLADTIMTVVDATRKLPGAEGLELEENDLESVALKELDSVSKKIAQATQRLLDMQKPREGVDLASHEIHVALLQAAHAVGQAATILIQSATAAQKELIQLGRANKAPSPYKKDPAWAQGLISAAHEVAGTVEDLVVCSNKSVEGGGEEGVVAAVRMVGGATARLVNASRVKVDPNSQSQKRLETAAKGVVSFSLIYFFLFFSFLSFAFLFIYLDVLFSSSFPLKTDQMHQGVGRRCQIGYRSQGGRKEGTGLQGSRCEEGLGIASPNRDCQVGNGIGECSSSYVQDQERAIQKITFNLILINQFCTKRREKREMVITFDFIYVKEEKEWF